MNDEVKQVLSPKLMISIRSSRKLSSYFVRAKMYPIGISGKRDNAANYVNCQ